MSDDEAEMAALRRNQRFQVSAASKISEARKNTANHELVETREQESSLIDPSAMTSTAQ